MQGDDKLSARAGAAASFDGAAVRKHDFPADGEPRPTRAHPGHLVEAFEDVG